MTKPRVRVIAVALTVPLAVAALWLLRDATGRMADDEVRHGTAGRAVVLAVDGDEATVRIVRPTDTVVTVINRHGNYAVGDMIRVVHDPVDPTRASELGAPTASNAWQRASVVGALIGFFVIGSWLYERRRPEDDSATPARSDVVRGGRLLEPEPVR